MLRIDDAVRILGEVSQRYCTIVDGIQIVNEPSWLLSNSQLNELFQRGYDAIRAHGDCMVVLSLFPADRYLEFPADAFSRMTNIAIDLHFYVVFGPLWQSYSLESVLREGRNQPAQDVRAVEERFGVPALVGEWSSAMAHRPWGPPLPVERDLYRMSEEERSKARRFHVCTQMHMLAGAGAGSYIWAYKTGWGGAWSAKALIREGMLNNSMFHEDCEVEVVASKLDDVTTLAFGVVYPLCLVIGCWHSLRLKWRGHCRPHCEQPFSRKHNAPKFGALLQVCWTSMDTALRVADLYSAWFMLPILPVWISETVPTKEDESSKLPQWWTISFVLAVGRAIFSVILTCHIPSHKIAPIPVAWSTSPVGKSQDPSAVQPLPRQLALVLRKGATPCEYGSFIAPLWAWCLGCIVSPLLFTGILRQAAYHEESYEPLWVVGHPLFFATLALTSANFLLSADWGCRSLLLSTQRRCYRFLFMALFVCCRGVLVVTLTLLGIAVVERLLAPTWPWLRHIVTYGYRSAGVELFYLLDADAKYR